MSPPPEQCATNEQSYLAQQAAEAGAAWDATLKNLRSTLRQTADVRLWTARYPWAAVGIAAVSGFLAGSRLAPRRRASGDGNAARPEQPGGAAPSAAEKTSQRFVMASVLMTPLMFLLKSLGRQLLKSLITSIVSPAAGAQPSSDGRPWHESAVHASTASEGSQA